MSTFPDAVAVRATLADFPDPETGRPLVDLGQLVAVDASADWIRVTVGLTTHSAVLWKQVRGRIEGRRGAAAVLQINPHTLRARMRKLGIDAERFRS